MELYFFFLIIGLDIAYVSNGYVYHTRNDRPEYIEQGCFQRGGKYSTQEK